jgi:hypothetical protein
MDGAGAHCKGEAENVSRPDQDPSVGGHPVKMSG